jgi:hypothetical protein
VALEEQSACITAVVVVDATTLRMSDACAGTLIELVRAER